MKDTRHIYADRRGYLTAAICINGRQHLKRVKTRQQAREWFLLVETQSTKASQLTFAQLNDAANALTMLFKAGATLSLTEVASQWLQGVPRASEGKQSQTLKEAITEYEERSKARVAEKTLKGYMLMLRHFQEDIGEQTEVATFSKADAVRYLDRFLDRPPTWRAYQRTLSKFFSEATKMDWCQVNPFLGLDAPKCQPPKREFMSVNDAKLALQSVMKRKPDLIHFLTLGMFAGIRPIESLRLTKEHFNLDTGYIHLTGDITKSHSYKERVVPINSTLMAWLKAYPFEEKPVPMNDICNIAKAMRECSELDHWQRTPDCLRHSWCTYEFARSRDSASVAATAGHSEAVCQRHYRGRVTPEEAKMFFDLMPDAVASSGMSPTTGNGPATSTEDRPIG